MMKFILEQSNEHLTSYSGLALIGSLLNQTQLRHRLNATQVADMVCPEISHGDVAVSYIGLLAQGKSDFDDIESFRQDDFFALALGIANVPSSPTLRQRIQSTGFGADWKRIILDESIRLLKVTNATLTPTTGVLENHRRFEWIPLDIDVSPFDNSKTQKEGVSPTYKRFDGYSPIFAYLGQEGYAIHELRPGKDHCQKNTPQFLAQSIENARRLTSQPLLVRLDSGNDSADNIRVCLQDKTKADFIIKRNLCQEPLEMWLDIAKEVGTAEQPREGKTVYWGSIMEKPSGLTQDVRISFQVIERTIRADGQVLLIPEIEVHTFWTSLSLSPQSIKMLYQEHGTSEQFHSEIKTDLDLE